MPVNAEQPKTVAVQTYECDRCHRKKVVEIPVDVDYKAAEPVREPLPITPPQGWEIVHHPDPTGLNEDWHKLVFDTRSCMSAWFATWIRVRYGGPEELPKRKVGTRKPRSSKPAPPDRPSPTQ